MKKHNYPLNKVEYFATIHEMMSLARKEAGETVAFRYKKAGAATEKTYSEFYREVYGLGTALDSLDIRNDHIACIGDNSYEWICAFLSVLTSDSVFVPIDRELPESDILNVLNNSDSHVLFYSSRYETMLHEHADELSYIKYFIGFDLSESDADGKFLSYEALLKSGCDSFDRGESHHAEMRNDINALKLLVYTSGTTGMAKGVMLTEHNIVSCVYYGLQVSTVEGTGLSVLPYHHTYEAVTSLLVSLHHHNTICINDKLRNVLKNMKEYKPDYIYLVPAFAELFYKKIWATATETGRDKVLRRLIKLSRAMRKTGIDIRRTLFASIHENFGGNLVKLVCGGAPIRAEIGQFFDDIGIVVLGGYGITECSPLVSVNREFFNDPSTVGVPLPCINVDFEEVNEDGNGEICVRGDTVMLGYYKNEEETARVLKDGWFHTGDYGCMNDLGQLLITGRKKNLIVLNNGKNIYPEEIENYILSVPYISEVVVYGIKDGQGGESGLCAEVYLNQDILANEQPYDDIDHKLKKDIGDVCRPLPSYKQISKVIIRDTEFDKTTSNKIKRNSANGIN